MNLVTRSYLYTAYYIVYFVVILHAIGTLNDILRHL